LWLAASALALAASVWALARLSTLRPRIVWAALLLSVGLVSGFLGQLVPFALAALCFAALWIEEGRTWPAACAAAAACVEPHFGLPACLGLAVFFPRARPPLAALALGGALLAFATLGVAENLEYLERVLPAHLASEVANEEQYSLTHALALAGVPAAAALRLGSVAYGAAVVAAILLAAALLRRAAPPSLGVLLPAAFAPLGGAFVHVQQMAFALPAVLVLLGRVAPGDVLLGLALVLLALPLGDFTFLFLIAPAVAAAVFVLLREQLRATLPVACGTAALAVAASAALTFSYASRPDAHAAVAAVAGPDELAEATWGALIATSYHSNVVLFSISKLPSYAGLALLVIVTVRRAAYGRDDPARVEAEAPPCES
ncbi:MAG TPA: glycosyltransferase 87 family protein, partial [Candidatus Baltobacteraceae bacterium]|nr:glycosyltransferase 87 family protein [Candidatus Baltobacteraceae bacterium]